MAAVYLHNALYARNPQEAEISLIHSRNLSTFSNATCLTSTTIHSQPTEPLLHTTARQTTNYEDQLDHIPGNRDETTGREPYEDPLMIDENPVNEAGKTGYWARNRRRPLKRWKWFKLGLQASLAAWAIYNTVRYFIAFAEFGGPRSQTFCLALGTSTGVSFLLACISFLTICDRNGLANVVTHSYLSYVGLTLDYFSSFLLLGPAVVNFALLFIWKDAIDPHFNLDNRCHLDIDVIWSVSNTLCSNKSPRWAIWLTLSSFRLALTLIIIIGYHIVSSLHHGPRRRRVIPGFRTRTSEPSTPEGPSSLSLNLPLHRDLSMVHRLSDSTLCGTARGEPSPQNQIRLTHSHSSSLSRHTSEPITLGRSTIPESENEHDLNEFVDQFHLVVSQIAQETDEALDLVRSEHSPSPENIPVRDLPPSYDEEDLDGSDDTRVGHSHNNGDNIFNLPPVPPALGYNEFGLPYPPDQNVRVLNGYIRRMPTIESMGSGEGGSSIYASSNNVGESIHTYSRPPTRNTRLSWNSTGYDTPSSESPSRANSLSARAELLVGLSSITSTTSEHGELLGRTSPLARRLSTPLSYVDYAHSESYSNATSGSRGTSYHSAMSESFLPPRLTPDTQSRSPVSGQLDSEHLLA